MKAALVIAFGWTLAVVVGALTMPTVVVGVVLMPANVAFALGCGVLMTPVVMLAAANVPPAERDVRRLSKEQDAAKRDIAKEGGSLKYAAATDRFNDAALLLSARFAVLAWATVLTAAVPLMVLWRLGGAE